MHHEGSHNPARRDFLKTSTMAAAGLAAATAGVGKVFGRTAGFTPGMQINPSIDNLRVVACCNPAMETSSPLKWDTVSQNSVVDPAQVSLTMDKMACALAQVTDVQSAWSTILRKPDAKSWQDVIAAIKVNCSGSMHPRAAIIDKVCRVLNGFGVPFPNITVYDTTDPVVTYFGGFTGTLLPADIVVSGGGATFPVVVMGESLNCTTLIQNADILVDIASNKPHIATWVGLTMTCKNHVGTVNRSLPTGSNCPQNLTQLFEINKHDAIIGTPGTGVPCRQQLCIVDSLWSSNVGDWSSLPNCKLYYLVMGTFGPAVDYLTTRKIRIDMMKCTTHPDALLNQFITYFGYSDTERDNLTSLTPDQNAGRGWVEVPITGIEYDPASRQWPGAETCELVIGESRVLRFSFPASEAVLSASICSADGRLICSLRPQAPRRFVWDGSTSLGARAGRGWYYLHVKGARTTRSFHLAQM
ncbi:MAG TPA: twin-arginine translocation signal domain-containing protein [Chitinivibrionales bacterium]|jgi:hypothetical protein|nr:twin-arginine translocation signal domain-containing protein [Chitinivibrionales bacterium]